MDSPHFFVSDSRDVPLLFHSSHVLLKIGEKPLPLDRGKVTDVVIGESTKKFAEAGADIIGVDRD